jgi:hypothetical protein
MKVGKLLVEAVTVFAVSLVVSIVVSVLWNLAVHRSTAIDWETSIRFAILLGILVPWIGSRRSREP